MYSEIIAHNQARVQNIYNSFEKVKDDSGIEKSITVEEFNKKFGSGHEVYTPGALAKFKASAQDSGIEKGLTGEVIGEEIKKSLEGLQRVLVADAEEKVSDFFVRKKIIS